MPKRTFTASVTYEYPQAAPDTIREQIIAASAGKAASSACRLARKRISGRRPSSIVVVLQIERDAA